MSTVKILKDPAKVAVTFFAAMYAGKYHAAEAGADTALCDPQCKVAVACRINVNVGDVHVHPIICKRCLMRTIYRDTTSGLRS